MTSEKYPYRFTTDQTDELAVVIGNHMHSGKPQIRDINDEIGIAQTRHVLSDVQSQVLKVLGWGKEYTVLMFTEDEVSSLLDMELPPHIEEILRNGIR